MKEDLLESLDSTNLKTCSPMQIKPTYSRRNVIKFEGMLDWIRKNDFWAFCPCFIGQKYFLTFIDEYSKYMYLYPIHEKNLRCLTC